MKNSTKFTTGGIFPDDNGTHINAHGGGILYHGNTYYWFGEHKISGKAGNSAHVGVHVYHSTDLYNWKDAGIALAVSMDPESDITTGCVLERPKVIRNRKTGKFVMWFHLERKGQGYSAARVGLAIADAPAGPYTFLRSFRPNAGFWPINATETMKAAIHNPALMADMNARRFSGGPDADLPRFPICARDFAGGQMSRDMTLFVDDDGKAYHIYSSEDNSTLHISLLTDDYLDSTGTYMRLFEHRWHEAPALCKHRGRYWLLSSGCTGWAPNAARSAVADSIWGPWEELGNPTRGINPNNELGPEKTFGAQSTFILPVADQKDTFIAMFDLWCPENAIDGRYLWLPIHFSENRYTIPWG